MIDYLRHIAVFSRVAEEESFSKAARSLGIAPSRVSESVSKLEHYVGVTLFNRTTRKIALTSEGRRLHEYTSGMLEGTERGLNSLRESKSIPMGTLRLSIPSFLSSSPLAETIGQFIAQHPQVYMGVDFTDHDVDPVKHGYDMCIRSGYFRKSNFTVRKLGEFERVIVVGREYLSEKAKLHCPTELMKWDWINYRHERRLYKLKSNDGRACSLAIHEQARLQVDSIDALYSFACMNLGVTVMPMEFAQRGIEANALVRLFKDWQLSPARYSAVWPEKSRRESLISVLVDFLEDRLQPTSR